MGKETVDSIAVLASFATLKSLSDEKKYKSSYQILQEFIRYIIIEKSLYIFSAIEMRNQLNSVFGFNIPEAVIKSAARKMADVTLNQNVYVASQEKIGNNSYFKDKKDEANESSVGIVKCLSEYIIKKTNTDSIDEKKLTQQLVGFLIEDQLVYSDTYTDLIGEFILKNEHNAEIQKELDNIREGSILYLGLSYNIKEIGSISKPICLYLSTEILFSLVGFNGIVYRQLAEDFYSQVKVANSRGKKKISLFYFSETKIEIDEYFAAAESIVDGKNHQFIEKPAMKSIINGCTTSADVLICKSDFYHSLQYKYGILEDNNDDYYNEVHFTSNLESIEDENDADKNKKKEEALKLVSHINKRRDGKIFDNDLDSEHLLVTNTKATLIISNEQTKEIKKEQCVETVCNFAVSLDRITSILWYKLGNGFSKQSIPSNVSALIRAKMVLSSSIAKRADKVFSDIKSQYKEGKITKEQVAARIIMLKNKPNLPEELQGDEIDTTMDFSPEYISRYEEEFKTNQRAVAQKDEIINAITKEKERGYNERDSKIAFQEDIIKNTEDENRKLKEELCEYHKKDEENSKLKSELEKYQQKEKDEKRKKEKRKNIIKFILSIAWKLLAIIAITGILLLIHIKFNLAIIPYIIFAVDVLGFIVSIVTIIKKDKKKYLNRDTNE